VFHRSELLSTDSSVWKAFLPAQKQVPCAGLDSYKTTTKLGTITGEQLTWQAESECESRNLYTDGRAIVTQEDGQVCFLQTYMGNQRVSVDELAEVRKTVKFRAGKIDEIRPESGQWIILDIGFSSHNPTCGIYLNGT